MNHHDAEISDVVVILDTPDAAATDQLITKLKELGMQVDNVDADNNTVEGSIDSTRVHDVKGVPGVRYVRSVFSYVADYPPGDPRDKDGQEDSSDGDEE